MSIIHLLENTTYLTLFICLILSFMLSGLILTASYNLGLQTPDSEKTSAYECGFEPFEDARNRFDVRFYIVAILFLIFDIEVVYLFPWASTLSLTGYTSYGVRILFLILLTIGFVYEVVKGALNIQLYIIYFKLMELIQITINNKVFYVRPEATILQACEIAAVDIPHFCYHEKLSVAGNCRICLVEVSKSPKPVVSCAIPVSKGMVVFTDTPLVRKAREAVLEFLLLNHPLDCPICDQGGECDLQDESLTYGSDRGRYFIDFKRSVEDKECGPIVKTIITRCIHCTRCVRFSTEIAGNEVRGSFGRGEETEIGTYVQAFIKTELSGNLVDLCPVGALTSKPYAYKTRNWEANRFATVDLFDAVASDIVIYTRNQSKINEPSNEKIMAILPIKNGVYSDNWITDRTRYAFDGLYAENRFNPQSKIAYNAGKVSGGHQLHNNSLNYTLTGQIEKGIAQFYIGSQVNFESLYTLDTFAKRIYTTNPYTYNQIKYTAKLLIDFPFFYSLNKSVNTFYTHPLNNIIRIGSNIRYEASLVNTRFRREFKQRGATYITLGCFNSLAYAQNHKGNSVRSILSTVENRIQFVKTFRIQSNSVGIYVGVNNLCNSNSAFIQQIIRQIAKYFFSKNTKKDRLGYVHSNVGSLAFSYMHMNPTNVQIPIKTASNLYFIGINPESTNFFDKTTVFSTNFKQEKKTYKNHYVLSSFYESTGHILSIEGTVSKHNKVVTAPSKVYNLATFINYAITKDLFYYYLWGKSLSKFKTERLSSSKGEYPNFNFNPFIIKQFFSNYGTLIIFTQPVKNFYIDGPIASSSITIAECAIFLSKTNNIH